MRRRIVWACLLGGLAAAGCGAPPVEQVDTTEAVPVMVDEARIATIDALISVIGSVAPAPGAEWTIIAPESARIAELPVAAGDPVREGDLLVRFDIPSLPAELAARRAAVDQATVRLSTARANVVRLSGLFDRGIAAQREVEEARRTATEADAELAQAQSGLTAAAALADRAVVRARFPGVVSKRWHGVGDQVEAAASDPVLHVIDPARMQVIAAVPVAALPRIAPGQTATIHAPGGADETATVVTRPTEVDPANATAGIRLTFTKPTRLASGTIVQVDITAESKANALVVPATAVIRDGDETFVMIAGSDSKAHKRAVTLGLTTRDRAQILTGLQAGDKVILRGPEGLGAVPDGAAITVAK